jgi:D-lactate dehydrogenase
MAGSGFEPSEETAVKIAMFSSKGYTEEFFSAVNEQEGFGHELTFLEPRLNVHTAALAEGFPAACLFVNDQAGSEVIARLAGGGTKLLALRSAGFNNVDIAAAEDAGLAVVRVPAYSPHAVAEHTVGLMLTLNRKVHRAYARVREGNFALEGLMGFDMHGKTVGVIGTGRIGAVAAKLLHRGFGCEVLAHDIQPNDELRDVVTYVDFDELAGRSDVVTLHCPLTPETYHLLDADAFARMKPGVMLINTSRGALIDTPAAIDALKEGRLGSLGIDVYEEEGDLFFQDLSGQVIQDDVFARLLTLPNVLITGHQAFFTREAVWNIAETTLTNVSDFEAGKELANCVTREMVKA